MTPDRPHDVVLRWDRRLPLRLAQLHGRLPVGATVRLVITARRSGPTLADLLEGAGFSGPQIETDGGSRPDSGREPPVGPIALVRARTLADTVGARMRLLLCGLNPSIYAADAGVAFARPGNRLWPAVRLAGLTDLDRRPLDLLTRDGIGLTDLVKRPTVGAGELAATEYGHGLDRVARLCHWLRPRAVVFVGLAGWRAAADRHAAAGWQDLHLGPTPVYVMPSTSGLNAHSSLAQLAEHLRRAADGI